MVGQRASPGPSSKASTAPPSMRRKSVTSRARKVLPVAGRGEATMNSAVQLRVLRSAGRRGLFRTGRRRSPQARTGCGLSARCVFSVVIYRDTRSAPSRASGNPEPQMNTLIGVLGALSSQTKCNTFLERCCHGAELRTTVIGGPMPDCPSSSRGHSVRQIAAALDRAPSTISREIRLNRGAAHCYKPSFAHEQRLRVAGRALGCNGRLAAPRCPGAFGQRLVSRADRRKARPRTRPQGHQLREHLSLPLRPDRPYHLLKFAAICRAARVGGAAAADGAAAPQPSLRPCFRG